MVSTLVLLGLVAQLFSILGSGVNGSRNSVEMADRLRTVQYTLRHDLAGATAFGRTPPLDPASGLGFFEIIEGPWHEYRNMVPATSDERLVGDCDDMLIFTTRAVGEPFTGKVDATYAVQSPYAEVMYFCNPTDNTTNPTMYTLHRRQRLVMAHPNAGAFQVSGNNTAPLAVAAMSDISCRQVGSVLVPNTLGDLTKRENRFMRTGTFPYDIDFDQKQQFPLGGERFGEDIILTNVIAFDVKVFDPAVSVQRHGDMAVFPGEPGYDPAYPPHAAAGITGAFVDLNWAGGSLLPFGAPFPPAGGAFQGRGLSTKFGHMVAPKYPTYDTWSTHYGIGTAAGPDAYQPPYPVPLRGIEITIRCYEPASRQIRQVTIRHSL